MKHTNYTVRPVSETGSQQAYKARTPNQQSFSDTTDKSYGYHDRQPLYDEGLQHQPSIPRKQVGTPSTTYPSAQTPLPSYHRKSSSGFEIGEKSTPTVPGPLHDTGVAQAQNVAPQQSSTPVQSKANSRGIASPLSGQAILDRAGTNTKETHVIESVAPGKLP